MIYTKSMMKKILLPTMLFLGMFSLASASQTIGTIDPQNQGYNKAYLVNNGGLNNISREIIVGKFITQNSQNSTITDYKISGWMWGAATGWISFTCENTNSCASSDYKVTIDREGYLSGYAWGPQAGWVNFAPTGAGSQTARIMENGDFVGYAWSQVFGYISFNCSNDNSCGTTDFKTSTDFVPVSFRRNSVVPISFLVKQSEKAINEITILNTKKDTTKTVTDNTVIDKKVKEVVPVTNTSKGIDSSSSKLIEGPTGAPNIVKFVPTSQPPEITQPKGSSEINKTTQEQKPSADPVKNDLKKKAGLGILTVLLLIFLMTRI